MGELVLFDQERLQQSIDEAVKQAVRDGFVVPRLLTPEQVGEYFSVAVTTVREWRYQGCPCLHHGKLTRFDLGDVLLWLGPERRAALLTRAERHAALGL